MTRAVLDTTLNHRARAAAEKKWASGFEKRLSQLSIRSDSQRVFSQVSDLPLLFSERLWATTMGFDLLSLVAGDVGGEQGIIHLAAAHKIKQRLGSES